MVKATRLDDCVLGESVASWCVKPCGFLSGRRFHVAMQPFPFLYVVCWRMLALSGSEIDAAALLHATPRTHAGAIFFQGMHTLAFAWVLGRVPIPSSKRWVACAPLHCQRMGVDW